MLNAQPGGHVPSANGGWEWGVLICGGGLFWGGWGWGNKGDCKIFWLIKCSRLVAGIQGVPPGMSCVKLHDCGILIGFSWVVQEVPPAISLPGGSHGVEGELLFDPSPPSPSGGTGIVLNMLSIWLHAVFTTTLQPILQPTATAPEQSGAAGPQDESNMALQAVLHTIPPTALQAWLGILGSGEPGVVWLHTSLVPAPKKYHM